MKKRLLSIMDTGRKSKLLAIVFTAAVLSLTVLFGAAWGGTALAAATGAEQTQEYIGDAQAKAIALDHAKITESQATFVRAHLDYDDGRVVYDVEFYSGNTEYDYEIDAVNGEIREFDRDIEYYAVPNRQRATTDVGQYIGETQAKSIALEAAGIPESQAIFIKAYLDSDDGSVVYDVEFYSGSTEYDYEVDAVSGDIVAFDQEIEYYSIPQSAPGKTPSPAEQSSYIGEDRAKSIALAHAGVTEAQAADVRARLDRDDGRIDYDVDFYVGNTEYEYEIDTVSGSVIEYDRENENRAPRDSASASRKSPRQSDPAETGGYIGEAKAKSIALSAAGLSESQTTRMKVRLDRDDGKTVYEVEFTHGRMEYEYEIDAATGAILESDAEYDD
jgi:uncharacterized membrane protein YkoI